MSKVYEYIEFVALPGSGKSTISLELYKELYKKNDSYSNITFNISRKNKIVRVMYKIKYILSAFLEDFNWCIMTQKIIFRTRQKSIKDLIKVSTNYYFVYGIIINAVKSNKKIILDQGIFQAIWSINYSAKNKVHIQSLIPEKLTFHYVTELISDYEIIINRLKARESLDSRMQTVDSSENELIIKNYCEFIEELKSILKEKNIEHIVLENNVAEDIKRNTKMLVELLG